MYMKLSVNESKLTGFCARNCATIQQFFVSKFARAFRETVPRIIVFALILGLEPEIEFTSYVSCAKRYALQQNCKEFIY